MRSIELKINGMTCPHCIKAVEVKLSEIDVESHNVDINKATVKFDENKVSVRDIHNAVEDAGYKVAM